VTSEATGFAKVSPALIAEENNAAALGICTATHEIEIVGFEEGAGGSEGPHGPRPPRPKAHYTLCQAGKIVFGPTPVKEKSAV